MVKIIITLLCINGLL